jgi:hypothetical protein
MHAFEDAKMEKGQTEWRVMVQIGCRCPQGKQDAFLVPRAGARARGPRDASRLAPAAQQAIELGNRARQCITPGS